MILRMRRSPSRLLALLALAACVGGNADAKLGSLQITINAPPGMTPRVHVASYNSLNGNQTWDLTSSQTLENLASGYYLIVPNSVQTPAADYDGMPGTQNALVKTGTLTEANVTYEFASRLVRFKVSGIPSNPHAVVHIDGGVGLPDTVTVKLSPGVHQLSADMVSDDSDFTTWLPARLTWPDTVFSSASIDTEAVNYSRAVVRITVDVTGLPAGATPALILHPPVGPDVNVNASGTVTDSLPLGDYSLFINAVTFGGTTYNAATDPYTFTLSSPQDYTVTVIYLPQ